MMLHTALILAALVILTDAFITRQKLFRGGVHEDNRLRLFLIQRLGMNGGTLGVGAVMAGGFVALGWHWPATPTVIVSVLFVVLAFSWVAYHNYTRKKNI